MKKFDYIYDPWVNSGFYKQIREDGKKLITPSLPVLRNSLTWFLSTITFTLAGLALIPLLSVFWEILRNGLPNLSWEALTSLPAPPGVTDVPDGFAHAIVGTVMMVGLASLASIPVGVLIGIYLSEFKSDPFLPGIIRYIQRILASVPSIVIGVFAYGLIVFTTKKFSAIAGSFALMLIMLPTISLTTEESLKLVPQNLRLASFALGGNKFQTIFKVAVKSALGGITTSCMLAFARAAGETAPLIFTALFSNSWSEGFTSPTPSLSVMIYNYSSSPFEAQKSMSWTASLVLLLIVLGSNIISRLVIYTQTKNNR